ISELAGGPGSAPRPRLRDLIESGTIPIAIRSTAAIVSQSHQPPRFGAHAFAQAEVAPACCGLSAEVAPNGCMGWTGAAPQVWRGAKGSVPGAGGAAVGIDEASKRCVATYSSMPSPRR